MNACARDLGAVLELLLAEDDNVDDAEDSTDESEE